MNCVFIAYDQNDLLTSFRQSCIENESVVCDWDTLKHWLESHVVSQIWWDLTIQERYSISEMTIKNTMFYLIRRKGKGDYGCVGNVESWDVPACTSNTVIRHAKFLGMGAWQFTDLTNCYWKRDENSVGVFCFVPMHTYNLPFHAVCTPSHSMCGLHIISGFDSLDNWIVFQYNAFDIKPPHWQMPTGVVVSINRITDLQYGGYIYTRIKEFTV